MATIASGTLTAASASSAWYTLTGRNLIYRGPAIASAVTVEMQDVGNTDASAITRLGTTMPNEATSLLEAGYEGTIQYRVTCTALGDTGVTYRISK